jgi:hypothetical protein
MYETSEETYREEISKNEIVFIRILCHYHPETKTMLFKSFFHQRGIYDDDENLQYLVSKQIDTFYREDGNVDKIKEYTLSSAFNLKREIIRELFEENL